MAELEGCPEWQDERDFRHDQGFVYCDDLTCQALQEPKTLQEYKTALKHFQSHSYLHGCSHGAV